jgi:hypothetical protein
MVGIREELLQQEYSSLSRIFASYRYLLIIMAIFSLKAVSFSFCTRVFSPEPASPSSRLCLFIFACFFVHAQWPKGGAGGDFSHAYLWRFVAPV